MAPTSKQNAPLHGGQLSNPFPGLRPFTIEESGLFFGREGQVEDVLQTLKKNRFVAVIGSSGSGKSSLIYCGIIPGIIREGNWKLIQIRPGNTPLENLMEGIRNTGAGTLTAEDSARIQQDPGAILKILDDDYRKTKKPFLIMIDQFEELFRYREAGVAERYVADRDAYVDFIVKASLQEKTPVLIIITMRSDFIGECSRFQEFTSLINKSNFLIPRMTRENFRKVIEGPLAVVNIDIEAGLVDRILDDVGDNPDQLPILQHALMRTLDYWKGHDDLKRPVSFSDYEAIGTIRKALSEHANDAFDELTASEKESCEKIFRALTERGADNRGVRRPTKVKRLAAITQAAEEEVIRIADAFRAPGRSFLTPSHSVALTADSVIDLSHEALMRTWDRLRGWVEEESGSVQMYRRLAESAALFQLGKSGLWRPPDLQLASNWKRKNNPSLAWAERYDTAFERTMVFLRTSEDEYSREEENKIRLQKRQLRRTRIFALVLGSAAIVSLVMFLWTRELRVRVEQQFTEAENQRRLAEEKTREAEEQRQAAELSAAEAMEQRSRADSSLVIAQIRTREAEQNAREAANNAAIAEKNLAEANVQRALAIKNQTEAEKQRAEAELAQKEAYQRRMLSVGKSMSVKSQQVVNDVDLKALLAYQAFDFYSNYGGNQHDVDIYSGLYLSLKALLGDTYNVYSGHQGAVRTMAFKPGTSKFISSGSDGAILEWDLKSAEKNFTTILSGRDVIEQISILPDGKTLLAAENNNGLLLVDLQQPGTPPLLLKGEDSKIKNIAADPGGRYVYTAGIADYIEFWDLANRSNRRLVETGSRINGLGLSPDGYILSAGLQDGRIMIWKVKGEVEGNEIYSDPANPVQSLAFSPDGKRLACGTLNGQILIFRADNYEIEGILTGHGARISHLEFSPDGKALASTSFHVESKVLFWDMTDFTNPPIVMDDNSGFVFSAGISPDGEWLVSGSAEENRLISRPTAAALLAGKICKLVSRDLTTEEWNTYVGEDITYKNTCLGGEPTLKIGIKQ
jgi:WD40 repeat protein